MKLAHKPKTTRVRSCADEHTYPVGGIDIETTVTAGSVDTTVMAGA